MLDREKVIKAIECCLTLDSHCGDCPYYSYEDIQELDCERNLRHDAIDMLKEQKEHDGSFIVIDANTGKEADTYNIALYEDWAKHLCYCDMDGWAIQDDGSLLLLDECGRYAYADRERFKVKWDV